MKEWESFSVGFEYDYCEEDEKITALLNEVEESGGTIFSTNTISFEGGGAFYISAWKEKTIDKIE